MRLFRRFGRGKEMETTERILARSEHYTVSHEYETVFLDRPGGARVVVGDFYGDPEAATIDLNENWAVIVGCGIVLYRLREPFLAYGYDKATDQWWEAHRSPPDEWWIESVYQVSDSTVRFVVDRGTSNAGVYELDVESLSVVRVIPQEKGACHRVPSELQGRGAPAAGEPGR